MIILITVDNLIISKLIIMIVKIIYVMVISPLG